jgi:hypothetical protein
LLALIPESPFQEERKATVLGIQSPEVALRTDNFDLGRR